MYLIVYIVAYSVIQCIYRQWAAHAASKILHAGNILPMDGCLV